MHTHRLGVRTARGLYTETGSARLPAWVLSVALLALASCGDDDEDDGVGHTQGVGNSCQVDEDCPTGTCYLGPAGGYCTAACSGEGTVESCPPDTVCKPIQGGPERCLLICGSETACGGTGCADTHCPSGSSCVDVSDTEHRACEPNP